VIALSESPAPTTEYCAVDLCPVRAEPSENSERITELMRWEDVRVLAEEADWLRVEIASQAGYAGWVPRAAVATGEALDPTHTAVDTCIPLSVNGHEPGDCIGLLWLGAWVRVVGQSAGRYIVAGPDGGTYEVPGRSLSSLDPSLPEPRLQRRLKRVVTRMLGVPYLWGGMSFRGIDCSGLVQRAFRTVGVTLRRDASQQWEDSSPDLAGPPRPGHEVFFGEAERITHVGIVLSGGWFAHASGRHGEVVVSHLSEEWYEARLLGSRRVLRGGGAE
jgi:gamma-D-glutamyl-L-lysine dipeptidyl-peptidase